jgi:hypothetical protein
VVKVLNCIRENIQYANLLFIHLLTRLYNLPWPSLNFNLSWTFRCKTLFSFLLAVCIPKFYWKLHTYHLQRSVHIHEQYIHKCMSIYIDFLIERHLLVSRCDKGGGGTIFLIFKKLPYIETNILFKKKSRQ